MRGHIFMTDKHTQYYRCVLWRSQWLSSWSLPQTSSQDDVVVLSYHSFNLRSLWLWWCSLKVVLGFSAVFLGISSHC